MITPEQIPDEVVSSALRLSDLWAEVDVGTMRIALAAALNAWPNWYGTWDEDATGVYRTIILPLPKEGE
jgi:hypothetical protein